MAAILVLAFGPLGLVYVRAWTTAGVGWLIWLLLALLDLGALWYAIAFRVLGPIYACHLIAEDGHRGEPDFESRRMLEEAAEMEDVYRSRAIEIYQTIVERYPESRACEEAERNIGVLRQRPNWTGD
ncbi:MAG: hypothetical protein ACPGVU_22180 [Limisphaerales bacterium]